jgi:putative DNA primase/helicase
MTTPTIDEAPNAGTLEASESTESTQGKVYHLQADAKSDKSGQATNGADLEKEITRLADLTPLEYECARADTAKALGLRASVLDKEVEKARKLGEEDSTNGTIDFAEVESWPDPVNPAGLLSDIAATIRRFIVCDTETANAATLWAAMTWFMDVVSIAPIAVITAPEKRCGKSQLLFLLGRIVRRPLIAGNISSSSFFRAIDAWKPTLLVDEADSFMRHNEELRGILNAGHTRDSAYVVRTVGDDYEPAKFNVWGAKAMAGIGHLQDTIMDRSVTLELRRKLPHESAERLRYAEEDLFPALAAKLARFAEDHRQAVRAARPHLPESLNDRAQDNWEPLMCIAEVAGGEWPELARKAALKLSGDDSSPHSIGTELLEDIKGIFEARGCDRITTKMLLIELCLDEEKRWATLNKGKPVSSRQIARFLKGYGIQSGSIRTETENAKGYKRERFEEVFKRYLPTPLSQSVTESQPSVDGGFPVTDTSTDNGVDKQSVTQQTALVLDCDGVTDKEG